MGGRSAIRGFLLQTIVCILDAIEETCNWISITIEPDLGSEKVDISVNYLDNFFKVTQVKSSQNQISLPQVKTWAAELKQSITANHYEIILIGPTAQSVIDNPIIDEVKIPTPKVLDITGLVDQASHKLDKYLSSRGFLPVPPLIREEFISSLITKLANYSTKGEPISRNEFDKLLQTWIIAIYPEAISHSFDMRCTLLADSFVMLPNQGFERPIMIPCTFINDGPKTVVVDWIAFKVIGNNLTKFYIPLAIINFEKFIQGKHQIHGENIQRNFGQFAVGAKQMKELTIAFNQDIASTKYPPSPWKPGKYEMQIYVKYQDTEVPKLQLTLKDVNITESLLKDIEKGSSVSIQLHKIEI